MLTNQRPIPGVSGARLADGRPLPASWEKLIRRAIHLDPKVRFANGAALAEALRELAGGAKRGSTWGRRPVALAAVASAVVIAAVVSWTSRGHHDRPLLTPEAQAVTMRRALPQPEPGRPPIDLGGTSAPVFVDQVAAPIVDRGAARAGEAFVREAHPPCADAGADRDGEPEHGRARGRPTAAAGAR